MSLHVYVSAPIQPRSTHLAAICVSMQVFILLWFQSVCSVHEAICLREDLLITLIMKRARS